MEAVRQQEAGPSSLSLSQFISTDQETSGFDISSGTKWIYPENYPRREYQHNIVKTALYNNTLVCLPTGLGKTFIAAVVMFNFWRWYPRGKVVFMAPTKPLVAQQIEACHEIMGIPSDQTIELTGTVNPTKRKQAWMEKRVIFATPQTFQKDIQNNSVPYDLIKCIVIDEAHRALGKHAYSEIIRMLSEKSKFFRVLALSATPGSKIEQVREVIQNLLISELELRDDTSPDITPYTNDRKIERIVVPLGKELTEYKERYVSIMDPHVRILTTNRVLQGNTGNISKGRIFMLMKQFESKQAKAPNHGTIMKTLNVLLTMYHAFELLIKHGLRAFLHFYENHSDKYWFHAEVALQQLLEDIKLHIGNFPSLQPESDGTMPEIPNTIVFGHTKFNRLKGLLMEHFNSFTRQNKSTRAIVFVEYRDIVNEVYILLLQLRPLIRPQIFVGQAGQKQKQQLEALEDFRNNKVNVLISTSVGEEGLDVGEVDLIVCFDISSSAPTRLVQRMGRTGRKRCGRVVILLTEGKEEFTLQQAMSKKDSLNKKVLESSNISSSLYQSSPRMIPTGVNPQCLPMFIKPQPKTPKSKAAKRTKQIIEKKPSKSKKSAQMEIEPQASSSNFVCLPSKHASKSKVKKPQMSMANFLNQGLQSEATLQSKKKTTITSFFENDSGVLTEEFQNDSHNSRHKNSYSVIRPGEVPLLTSDNYMLEFLTLCAMKQSDKKEDHNNCFNIDKTYIPKSSSIELVNNLFLPQIEDLRDWLRNLTLCKRTEIEIDPDEFLSETEQEECNIDENSKCSNSNESCSSQFFNNMVVVESKYVNANFNNNRKSLEIVDSDFFDDFDAVQPKDPEQNSIYDTVKILRSDDHDTVQFTEHELMPPTKKHLTGSAFADDHDTVQVMDHKFIPPTLKRMKHSMSTNKIVSSNSIYDSNTVRAEDYAPVSNLNKGCFDEHDTVQVTDNEFIHPLTKRMENLLSTKKCVSLNSIYDADTEIIDDHAPLSNSNKGQNDDHDTVQVMDHVFIPPTLNRVKHSMSTKKVVRSNSIYDADTERIEDYVPQANLNTGRNDDYDTLQVMDHKFVPPTMKRTKQSMSTKQFVSSNSVYDADTERLDVYEQLPNLNRERSDDHDTVQFTDHEFIPPSIKRMKHSMSTKKVVSPNSIYDADTERLEDYVPMINSNTGRNNLDDYDTLQVMDHKFVPPTMKRTKHSMSTKKFVSSNSVFDTDTERLDNYEQLPNLNRERSDDHDTVQFTDHEFIPPSIKCIKNLGSTKKVVSSNSIDDADTERLEDYVPIINSNTGRNNVDDHDTVQFTDHEFIPPSMKRMKHSMSTKKVVSSNSIYDADTERLDVYEQLPNLNRGRSDDHDTVQFTDEFIPPSTKHMKLSMNTKKVVKLNSIYDADTEVLVDHAPLPNLTKGKNGDHDTVQVRGHEFIPPSIKCIKNLASKKKVVSSSSIYNADTQKLEDYAPLPNLNKERNDDHDTVQVMGHEFLPAIYDAETERLENLALLPNSNNGRSNDHDTVQATEHEFVRPSMKRMTHLMNTKKVSNSDSICDSNTVKLEDYAPVSNLNKGCFDELDTVQVTDHEFIQPLTKRMKNLLSTKKCVSLNSIYDADTEILDDHVPLSNSNKGKNDDLDTLQVVDNEFMPLSRRHLSGLVINDDDDTVQVMDHELIPPTLKRMKHSMSTNKVVSSNSIYDADTERREDLPPTNSNIGKNNVDGYDTLQVMDDKFLPSTKRMQKLNSTKKIVSSNSIYDADTEVLVDHTPLPTLNKGRNSDHDTEQAMGHEFIPPSIKCIKNLASKKKVVSSSSIYDADTQKLEDYANLNQGITDDYDTVQVIDHEFTPSNKFIKNVMNSKKVLSLDSIRESDTVKLEDYDHENNVSLLKFKKERPLNKINATGLVSIEDSITVQVMQHESISGSKKGTSLMGTTKVADSDSVDYDTVLVGESTYKPNSGKDSQIKSKTNVAVSNLNVVCDTVQVDQTELVSDSQDSMELNRNYSVGSDLFYDDFNLSDVKKGKNKRHSGTLKNKSLLDSFQTTNNSPAHVEVPFESLLDEGTDSEVSQSSVINEIRASTNIFDDLLEADSSEEENSCNTTVVQKSQNQDDTIIVQSPKRDSLKRSSSISPFRYLKRQKFENSEDLSTKMIQVAERDRQEIALTAEKSSVKTEIDTQNKESEDCSDSEIDIFDDMEYETQFTYKLNRNSTSVESCEKAKEKDENKIELSNTSIFNDDTTLEQSPSNTVKVDAQKISTETKRGSMDLDDDIFIIEESPKKTEVIKPLEKSKLNETSLRGEFSKKSEVNKPLKDSKLNETNLSALDFDDWNDSFGPIPVSKSKSTNISNQLFPKIPKSQNSQKNNKSLKSSSQSSQEPSSSGWITIEKSKSTKCLASKNLKIRTSRSPIKKEKENDKEKLSFIKEKEINHRNDEHKILRMETVKPLTKFNSLEIHRSFHRDKDGFAVPNQKLPSPEVSVRKNKENELPWKKVKVNPSSSSISPRFRRYHSELNLSKRKKKKRKVCKKLENNFFEDEAEISSDHDTSEGSSGEDNSKDLESFVSYTQDVVEEVDMKAIYLQTVNDTSPVKRGKFLIKKPTHHVPDHEVFSQFPAASQLDETYMNDTFCVDEESQLNDDDSEELMNDLNFSMLDNVLESRGRGKSRNQEKSSKFELLRNERERKKKKIIVRENNSSSDDEAETLRKEILEESILRKKSKR